MSRTNKKAKSRTNNTEKYDQPTEQASNEREKEDQNQKITLEENNDQNFNNPEESE